MEHEFEFDADGTRLTAYVRQMGQIDGVGDRSLIIGYRRQGEQGRTMLPGLFDHRLPDRAVGQLIMEHLKKADV